MQKCREILGGLEPPDEDWQDDDEDALRDRWEGDPLKDLLTRLDVQKNKDVLPMWKITVRFLSCFPTSIISTRNHLRYEKSVEATDGGSVEDPNWTKTFCRRFANLVLHGVFQLKPSLVVLALLYVKICRVDYRGPIPWRNDTTDSFLDLFLDEMRDQDSSKSVVVVHHEILSRLKAEEKSPSSFVSTLMRRIEERVFKESEGDPYRPDEVPVFEVTPTDLADLTRAADAVKQAGTWVFLPTSVVSRLAKAGRKDLDEPRSLDQLNELREGVILNDRRLNIVDCRRQPPSREATASGGQRAPGQDRHHQSPDTRPDPSQGDDDWDLPFQPDVESEPRQDSQAQSQPGLKPGPTPAPVTVPGTSGGLLKRLPIDDSNSPQKRPRLDEPMENPMDSPMDGPTDDPTDDPMDQPMDEYMDDPMDGPMDDDVDDDMDDDLSPADNSASQGM
ncbi:hypothetical protein F4806DRAFT_452218 [Annulohypoxylon nitens]|nr:hypothetical protein F4806DRAFT_452218 [Annulohypoxylon nitens]